MTSQVRRVLRRLFLWVLLPAHLIVGLWAAATVLWAALFVAGVLRYGWPFGWSGFVIVLFLVAYLAVPVGYFFLVRRIARAISPLRDKLLRTTEQSGEGHQRFRTQHDPAVAVATDVRAIRHGLLVRDAPRDGARILGNLREGEGGSVIEVETMFVLLEFPDGSRGWVNRSGIAVR